MTPLTYIIAIITFTKILRLYLPVCIADIYNSAHILTIKNTKIILLKIILESFFLNSYFLNRYLSIVTICKTVFLLNYSIPLPYFLMYYFF